MQIQTKLPKKHKIYKKNVREPEFSTKVKLLERHNMLMIL